MIDPNNPVVKLCSEGMACEAQGDKERAAELYLQAWEIRQDDYEASMVAHYVARHQKTAEERLRWNLAALEHAEKVDHELVASFFPSLYGSVAKSYEDIEDWESALKYYILAEGCFGALPEGPYGDLVRNTVTEALSRLRP